VARGFEEVNVRQHTDRVPGLGLHFAVVNVSARAACANHIAIRQNDCALKARSTRILVVEDHEQVRQFVFSTLKKKGGITSR
jgi:hypothetical protein